MEKKIPFLDLRITDEALRRDIHAAVDAVMDHGRFILGPEVRQLEEKIAAYCGRKYGVGVNSGTDALFLTLKSLGIGTGDEVITTALSWIATANAVALTGATPVFADINDDLNIDPASVERLITPGTRAILPVHYAGKVCPMADLQQLAERFGLYLVEDASQAFGARYMNRVAGSFGTAACFSMNPMKVLPAFGEAGVVVTDDSRIRDRLISLRYNGMADKTRCVEWGLNGRIDTLQAAVLLKQLERVDAVVERRREIADFYSEQLNKAVGVPVEKDWERDVYYTYTIRTDRRDEVLDHLTGRGVEAKIRDPYLMPQQPAYLDTAGGDFPHAERLVKRLLCIPAHEKMSPGDPEYVVQCIHSFFQ